MAGCESLPDDNFTLVSLLLDIVCRRPVTLSCFALSHCHPVTLSPLSPCHHLIPQHFSHRCETSDVTPPTATSPLLSCRSALLAQNWAKQSIDFRYTDSSGQSHGLTITELHNAISGASVSKRADRVTLTLIKEGDNPLSWYELARK